MHWNILDTERKKLLPLFAQVSDYGLYLAGGTALALQIGHRDSVDFDFFTEQDLDTVTLFEVVRTIFAEHTLLKIQEEKNTLGILIDGSIKVSFMTYRYDVLQPLVITEFFPLASVTDIACMKCSAITSRGVMKDYVDLYFILQTMPLKELLAFCVMKYPELDTNLVMKSLVYFDDLEPEQILFKEYHDVEFETVKSFLRKQVRGRFLKP